MAILCLSRCISQGSPEKQNQEEMTDRYTDRRKERRFMIEIGSHGMEAKKSHPPDLPSASWRPRKTRSTIQSKSGGLRTREANGVSARV